MPQDHKILALSAQITFLARRASKIWSTVKKGE